MKIKTEQFKTMAEEALGNKALQAALTRACGQIGRMRAQAFQDWPEGDTLRTQAHQIKAQVMDHLESHLEQLEKSASALGVKVHRSLDAEDARQYILGLIRSRNISLVVKSKSMTTEEIGLNPELEQNQIAVWETDLGEFIVQLAGEPPSHIIAPAIHKSQQEIAELFSKKLGVPLYDTPEKLTMVAREFLRGKYFQAGMGISGANFALAETGTLVIVENEGNARLTTTFPKIHVAVMGIEKVIPGLKELAVFLKVLARSATGQKLSTYMSFLQGPRRSSEEDGPEELHLVLLDNGRSKILQDPEMRSSLYCLRCGACLTSCPVYQRIGGHAYGWVYSGPIGATLVPQYLGLLRAKDLPMASTLCGACAAVCPVRIPLPDLLLKLRERIREQGGATFYEQAFMNLWAVAQSHPFWYRSLLAVAKKGKKILPKWFPQGVPLAEKTFHQWWHDENPD
ncbi:MAG: iron-sulfur cluster-binding protein [Desulfobacca sp.]|nr:iron-sulfur cluster-binding protein [Desulfobacca sp.]